MEKPFTIELLFTDRPQKTTANAILRKAKEVFGDIKIISRDEKLTSFTPPEYTSFSNGKFEPVSLAISGVGEFDDKQSVSEFARSQIWNVQNVDEVLSQYKYSLKLYDINASGQMPKQRAEMLVLWLEVALAVFPECKAIWTKDAGKLQLVDAIKQFKGIGINEFIFSMVNVRFFNIPDTNEFIVDSVGLANIGLSDVQFHFRGVNPNKVANLAYKLAWYMLNDDNLIKDNDTIDGLNDKGELTSDVQWLCHYEDSLIEPLRPVLDINMGKYAAGDRA